MLRTDDEDIVMPKLPLLKGPIGQAIMRQKVIIDPQSLQDAVKIVAFVSEQGYSPFWGTATLCPYSLGKHAPRFHFIMPFPFPPISSSPGTGFSADGNSPSTWSLSGKERVCRPDEDSRTTPRIGDLGNG